MNTGLLVLLIVVGVMIVAFVVLYFVGRKMQSKQNAQREQMEAVAQTVSMLVIDKKKMKLKDAGFPPQVLEQAPKLGKFMKYPVVKAKIGPKVASLMIDDGLFDIIPVKRECKVRLSGMYIIEILNARGGIDKPTKKPKLSQRIRERALGHK